MLLQAADLLFDGAEAELGSEGPSDEHPPNSPKPTPNPRRFVEDFVDGFGGTAVAALPEASMSETLAI